MRIIVVEPPSAILTYEDAVARLKLDGDDDEQTDVEGMIAAATGHIDGPEGWLGRALGPQTLEVRFDGFDHSRHDAILLPCPPVVNLVSLSYIDPAGVLQTLDPSNYELLGRELVPAYRTFWPQIAVGRREAVRIRYRAGYVADPAADPLVANVPAAIMAALLLMVGDLYSNRETTVDARASAAVEVPMSTTVTNLLTPLRVWG